MGKSKKGAAEKAQGSTEEKQQGGKGSAKGDAATAGGSAGKAEDGTLITYVIPCVSCSAFLSLTKETQLDQICQACKTGVKPLVELILEDKFEELPLPPASQGKLITAVCTGEDCKRTAQFPKGYAIYCPVCLKNVMKEKFEKPKGCCEFYLGDRGKRWGEQVESCFEYIGTKPNPMFQMVYLVIMCCWFYLYYKYGWAEESVVIRPLVKELPGGLDLHLRIMELGFGFGVFLLIKCYVSDPGRVTEQNREQVMALYKHPDPALGETPLKWCNTCRFLRPPRTHHCRMCDVCVTRFDHHCVWLNTCIGAKNLRWFLSFVAWHALLCWYGVGFVFMLLRVIARKLHTRDPAVVDWLGSRRYDAYMRFIPHTWGTMGGLLGNAGGTDVPWAVVWAMNVPLMILMIFCMVMGAVLGSFFFVHVLQVLRNQTSYEGWTYTPMEQKPTEASGDAAGGGAAESCTPPPAPAESSGSGAGQQEKEAVGNNKGEGKQGEQQQQDKEEEEDDPDRGTTCRIKRQEPPETEDGSLPAGQWVSKHDTGSKWTNIKEVLFPPPIFPPSVVAADKKKQ